MSFLFASGERALPVAAVETSGGMRLQIDGDWHEAALTRRPDGAFDLALDGRTERVFVALDGDHCFVHLAGESFEIQRVDPIERLREARAAESGEVLKAPMPGVVVEVLAAVGTEVAAGDTVIVIESMKLQTALTAHAHGRVAELGFAAGQSFEKNAALARIERSEEDPR